MLNPLNILIVSPEVAPFAKTGGLADVAGALPKALRRSGYDVRVILPLYKCVLSNGYKLKKVKSGVRHDMLKSLPAFDIYEHEGAGITAYFIDKKDYFDRDDLYGTSEGDYPDNAHRFDFFSQAVLASIKALDLRCDVIHCNDWQSALIPVYLKFRLVNDPFYRDTKTLFTIHNLAYQGQFPGRTIKELALSPGFFNVHAFEFYRKANFMKAGILHADAIGTVSKGYAKEILTREYGCGLEKVLNTRKNDLFGITNGVDYTEWSPENDPYIKEKYDYRTIEKKSICKKDLLDILNLSNLLERPVLGIVTRLAWQKGIDLLADIAEDLVRLNVGLVVLGRGGGKYQGLLSGLAKKYPGNISVNIKVDNALAHKIEAGADLFLMPSRYEPCGLSQMYSLKYGTIPIVRATGGLDDVIVDLDENSEKGNGFKFAAADKKQFLDSIKRAVKRMEDKTLWKALMTRVMQEDFSWDNSAKEYGSLYGRISNKRTR